MITSPNVQPQVYPSESLPLAWWLQIEALEPDCLYFIGPFDNQQDADASKASQLDVLKRKQGYILAARSKFCQLRQAVIPGGELTFTDLSNSSLSFFTHLITH